ncbi:oligosaccharide flippase family protein [Maritimibacter dapengensis]|uniref:Oligosaccharide flippase family protein n=1 Tax=Maritimibacter dapengensis TaxID=2836868 RepID=A0ABS6T519_9RHOB|nr:oligosaccharide flippase family protein [Maritimibacter dapengensis]MBV7379818.1 oligosaccharide flippase family protein [Maritimibacter dapengensis]
MLKSALLLLSGNASSSAVLFIRNLLIARLISVEDYGIAATFAISMGAVEMLGAIGLQHLIIQDDDGDNPKKQAGLQGFHLLRGFLSAAILFFLSGPISRFMGVPEIAWAFQVLAIVPLVRGFVHFDIYRLQRQMEFLPLVSSALAPALVSTALVWPIYLVFPNYRVMLFALIIQAVILAGVSHAFSKRAYRVTLDRGIMTEAISFGWPLLLNSILLFGVFQGEKIIVGRELGMEQLALLAMGFTLTLTPTLILASSARSFFLPQLSRAKNAQHDFQYLSIVTMQSSLLNGALLVTAIFLFGGPLVHFVLGPKYSALIPYLPWLALLNALRVFKAGCAVVALAKAHTTNAMISNMFRVATLPISWFALISGADLYAVIIIAIVGEMLGYLVALALVHYKVGVILGRMILPLITTGVLLTYTLAQTSLEESNIPFSLPQIIGFVPVALLLILSLYSMYEFRRYIKNHSTFIPFKQKDPNS